MECCFSKRPDPFIKNQSTGIASRVVLAPSSLVFEVWVGEEGPAFTLVALPVSGERF